jgi:hypothetical protein
VLPDTPSEVTVPTHVSVHVCAQLQEALHHFLVALDEWGQALVELIN